MAHTYKHISIVIPAFNPDYKLIDMIEELSAEDFQAIIIVNDGSGEAYDPIFAVVRKYPTCTVLTHTINQGKGKALKTAFSYYSENYPDGTGVITADADGQHTPSDIKKVAAELAEQPSKLILGVRDFSTEDMPLRSRFGNVLTKGVVKAASGMKITDTQTGLRGISKGFAEQLLNVSGDRYEFEMKMILACKTYHREIKEVTIDTIYIDNNESSHFNPVIDSIKIYYVFLRFLFSSLASFVVDVGLFALFSTLLKALMPMGFILLATVLARVLSSLFNYFLNRNIVFRSYAYTKHTLTKYYTLAVIQMGASAGGVYILYHSIGAHEVWIKIGVDSFLFLLSFYIQRSWVFKQGTAYVVKEVKDH
ncbi:dolichol-phosphate mannosyltransferase [Salibacterium salarium]|uniref:bifunctional glycosyltransferase family 2/GtrA family protein n=1 Tax=Salibacterium salarium TaxID=284579 RepID=UPI00278B5CAF|nr:bifunctional glycosyltransferase family 2/GtrA family protein [Salibacterium salarium]MDQ0297716.1 dolichol-phosphate mannosyltransferase [Salibacterium salarium]